MTSDPGHCWVRGIISPDCSRAHDGRSELPLQSSPPPSPEPMSINSNRAGGRLDCACTFLAIKPRALSKLGWRVSSSSSLCSRLPVNVGSGSSRAMAKADPGGDPQRRGLSTDLRARCLRWHIGKFSRGRHRLYFVHSKGPMSNLHLFRKKLLPVHTV